MVREHLPFFLLLACPFLQSPGLKRGRIWPIESKQAPVHPGSKSLLFSLKGRVLPFLMLSDCERGAGELCVEVFAAKSNGSVCGKVFYSNKSLT